MTTIPLTYDPSLGAHVYRGLGEAPPGQLSPQAQQAVTTINNIVAVADKYVPQVTTQYQSNFSKTTAVIASIAGTAAGVVQLFPAVGQIVGVVLLVVAGVAALLSKVFWNSKIKQMKAEIKQYGEINMQIYADNDGLFTQYKQLVAAYNAFRNELKKFGINSGGLGLCISECGEKKGLENMLNDLKKQYDDGIAIQKQLVDNIQIVYGQIDSLMKGLASLRNTDTIKKVLLGGIGAIAIGTALFAALSTNKRQK